ncbi:MAG: glycoside hydrolase [Actinomycetota bacterium]|nr:glycoside hydrolase [Actinomycetota bacterium]
MAMGAPAAAADPFSFTPLTPVGLSGSPFGSTSDGAACQNAPGQTGINFPGTQVEPWLAVDPANNANMVTVWQQDRWSDGGANAVLGAYSTDGGATWITPAIAGQPKFTNCTGGSGPSGGYTRASDPWVSIAPNGHVYFMALQADIGTGPNNAMSVAKSTDHGATWSAPIVLRRDTSANVLNDKNSITADPTSANHVYAIWDRLEFPTAGAAAEAGEHAIGYRGPTWFSRTTDGGASWERAHIIFDPGEVNQTIGNQIVVTGDGTLVDGFALINNFKNAHKARGFNAAVLRSRDRGATWSRATLVSPFVPGKVHDPTTGADVRTGDIIPEIAPDPRTGTSTVYMVWQGATASSPSSVLFSKSSDDGQTWSMPKVINTQSRVQAFTPSVRVGSDGTVTVTHYDFRNDTSSAPLETDVWSIHSHDGGATWSEDHISGSFDMSTAAVARGYFVGDYEGLDAGTRALDGEQFFEAGFGEADGTPGERSSHIVTSRGR